MTSAPPPALRIEKLSKTFPGTRALRDVNLEIRRNEVHALVGQNGSGKSTLIKTLAGYHRADSGGRTWLDGEPFDPTTAAAASRHDRLRFVHQDLGLVSELGVMDNLALRHNFTRGRFGNIDWRAQARLARELLSRFALDLDLRRPLSEATPVQRVIVAIVAAVQRWDGEHGVLVLDEPTAVLPPQEVAQLFSIIAEVRRTGASVLYVSHRLDEIFEIAERVSIIRGGEIVATEPVSATTVQALASMMAGENVDADYRADLRPSDSAPAALEASGLRGHYVRDVSLTMRRGEVLGVAGLLGSGREELPYLLAGRMGGSVSGLVRFPESSAEWQDLRELTRMRIALVPADRSAEAVVGDFSVRENLTLSSLAQLKNILTLSRRRETKLVEGWVDRLDIRTAGIDASIATLSGGNQQKVVIARCLAQKPSVMLLCEPTAGVDIATRIAIYDLIAEQAGEGLAVLVSSSDIGDLLATCTRVMVLRDGRLASQLNGEQITRAALIHAMEGSTQ